MDDSGAAHRQQTDPNVQSITSGTSARRNQAQKTALLAGGSAARRTKLSDITNTVGSETLKSVPYQSTPDYVGQLTKENTALLKLLAEKNKIIEVTGTEMQKYRMQSQKASQQNWQLARVNSQMLAELNLSKEKIKTLQHELSCTLAVFKAKIKQLEERDRSYKELIEKHGLKGLGSSEPEAVADVTHLTTGNITGKLSSKDDLKDQSICCTSSTQKVQHVDKVVERRKSVRKKVSDLDSEKCESVENLPKEANNSQPEDSLIISENKNCKRARKDIPTQQSMNFTKSAQLDALAEWVDERRKSSRSKSSNVKSEKHEAKVELPKIEDNQDPVDSFMIEMWHEETSAQPEEDPDPRPDSMTSKKGSEAADCSRQSQIAAAEDTDNTRRTKKAVPKESFNSKSKLSEAEASSNIENGSLPGPSVGSTVILQEASEETKGSNAAMRTGEEHDTSHSNVDEGELQRHSLAGRPLRRAAQQVSSYLEPSLSRKMRREDFLPAK